MDYNASMINYLNTGDLLRDMRGIIEVSRKSAYQAVNIVLVQRNWLLGRRIAEEELRGGGRAEYGLEIIKTLSGKLTEEYGKGFTKTNLYSFYLFYKTFPGIFHAVSGKSQPILSWTHYRTLLQVKDEKARTWYAKEAAEQTWAVRTLQRNIDSQYYYRLLSSQNTASVEQEMRQITAGYQQEKLEYLKNPVVAEFLGLSSSIDMTETQLESAILSNLQKFLMELGKGYAFVARQKHIHTEKQDYFIDLVFYNYILKCFVLIDLKTGKITHQDIGQMDMYIRMFDDMKRQEGDNPTVGILLCAERDETVVKYSVANGSRQLFVSKYLPYMPTEEEIRNQIERRQEYTN